MKILCYDCMESTYNIIYSLEQKFKPILEKANINQIHIMSLKQKYITKVFCALTIILLDLYFVYI